MKVPANAIAETVKNIEIQNESLQNQLDYVQEMIDKNNATLAELEPLAEWIEVIEPTPLDMPEPIAVDPLSMMS